MSLTAGFQKLIVGCGRERRLEMYDLVSDPEERHDLAHLDSSSVQEWLMTLRTLLGGDDPCTVINRAAGSKALFSRLDALSIEALRALGYLN